MVVSIESDGRQKEGKGVLETKSVGREERGKKNRARWEARNGRGRCTISKERVKHFAETRRGRESKYITRLCILRR